MAKLKLDLHAIYNRGGQIDAELNRIVQEALSKKIVLVEIIPGKGSGQLKKTVLRFLKQGHIRALYHRVETDDKNFGRIFVHFRFK
jgi:DNA-nicking Smr family endonuclease